MTGASIGADRMAVTVYRVHHSKIGELSSRYKAFGFLNSARVPDIEKNNWTWNETRNGKKVSWKYYQSTVIFIGKSGYGKSTTLNRIVGKEVFETDDIDACTKDLYCAVYNMNHSNDCFALCDLPGVGESMQADNEYIKW